MAQQQIKWMTARHVVEDQAWNKRLVVGTLVVGTGATGHISKKSLEKFMNTLHEYVT